MVDEKELPDGYNVTEISGYGVEGTKFYFTRSPTDHNPAHNASLIGKAPTDRQLYPSRATAVVAAWDDWAASQEAG